MLDELMGGETPLITVRTSAKFDSYMCAFSRFVLNRGVDVKVIASLDPTKPLHGHSGCITIGVWLDSDRKIQKWLWDRMAADERDIYLRFSPEVCRG